MTLVDILKKLIHETKHVAPYGIIAGFIISLILGISTSIRRMDILEAAVLGASTNTIPVLDSKGDEGDMGDRGEKGDKGDKGERGYAGKDGEMPEGHWEEFCLYPKNELGYRSEGAMIRKSSGNCKNSWRIIKLWEE